jgi:hypothetical protein
MSTTGYAYVNLTQQIESEIAKKDCNPGELFDAVQATYPEIFASLKDLLSTGKIEHYFASNGNGTPTTVLTYRKKPFWKT